MIKKISILVSSMFFSSHLYAMNQPHLNCDANLNISTSSNTIAAVEKYASQLNCSAPITQICVVFDIDNTLITNHPNLGDEAWGYWQSYLNKNDPSSPDLITQWLPSIGLYDTIASFRFLINFKQVEPITRSVVHNIQNQYPTIALTSRGFASFSTTERQLSNNHINFTLNPIGDDQFDNSFLQLNKNNNQLKMYYNGIYYTAGDSKGKNLLALIEYYRNKLHQPHLCSVVIAIDDTESHIEEMANTLSEKAGYIGIHYTALPKASDSATWTPDVWRKQSLELQNTIKNLNKEK